jgi:hypothetical protein
MLSFEKLKEFFILLSTFGVIYWFQMVDDKKRCKNREGIYDTIKLPLLATAIVGLVLFWEKENFLAIFISAENCNNNLENQKFNMPQIKEISNNIHKLTPELKPMNRQLDVYTDLPPW